MRQGLPARTAVALAVALPLLHPAGVARGGVPGFYPTTRDVATGGPVTPGAFQPARRCGYCHPLQYRQWKGSMHAAAFRDPLYRAVWREAVREGGSRLERACAGCHSPVGTAAELVWVRQTGEVVAHPRAEEGVTCDFCHSVVRLLPAAGGGRGGFLLDPSGPKRGPYRDAVSGFHGTQYSDLHTRSAFCGACHDVFHPAGAPAVARTFQEWRRSPYARAGIQCQDCHMVTAGEAALAAAALEKPVRSGETSAFGTERVPFFDHGFGGANLLVPHLLELEGRQDAEIVERLRSAAVVELEAPARAGAGPLRFAVKVRNVAAGHNLPTGMTELRQMWLHVSVVDTGLGGRMVWESGALDPAGRLDAEARTFGAHAVDERGRPTWKPWEVSRIVVDNSIPPRARATEFFEVPLPAGWAGPLEVRVRLRYRSLPQEVADRYLGGVRVPVVDMAAARARVIRAGR